MTDSRPLPFRHRRPEWLRVKAPWGATFSEVRQLMRGERLHTVCEEAHCPNIGECWGSGTATFLILGDVCTRSCGFCAVATGRPEPVDEDEPQRVAEAIEKMGLRHAVITSVNRDELPDGGASVFAECIALTKERSPGCSIEVLIPDFKGDRGALASVMEAGPDILNHNIETVSRLYSTVRPQADYSRSLGVLEAAKAMSGSVLTKTGIMVGLGEEWVEILQVMHDCGEAGVDIMTIGQYLRPSEDHVPIHRYYTPEEFELLRELGLERGLAWVESGPLVRSSYHAERQFDTLTARGPRPTTGSASPAPSGR